MQEKDASQWHGWLKRAQWLSIWTKNQKCHRRDSYKMRVIMHFLSRDARVTDWKKTSFTLFLYYYMLQRSHLWNFWESLAGHCKSSTMTRERVVFSINYTSWQALKNYILQTLNCKNYCFQKFLEMFDMKLLSSEKKKYYCPYGI